jgi:4-carboxymuconolactone decarboxylase
MAGEPTPAQKAYGDVAPGLADLSDRVLFGEVWERPGLSKRERSLITVAALVAGYRHNELPGHVARALANGVTREALAELVTHLAFYAGWPAANTAVPVLRKVFAESEH